MKKAQEKAQRDAEKAVKKAEKDAEKQREREAKEAMKVAEKARKAEEKERKKAEEKVAKAEEKEVKRREKALSAYHEYVASFDVDRPVAVDPLRSRVLANGTLATPVPHLSHPESPPRHASMSTATADRREASLSPTRARRYPKARPVGYSGPAYQGHERGMIDQNGVDVHSHISVDRDFVNQFDRDRYRFSAYGVQTAPVPQLLHTPRRRDSPSRPQSSRYHPYERISARLVSEDEGDSGLNHSGYILATHAPPLNDNSDTELTLPSYSSTSDSPQARRSLFSTRAPSTSHETNKIPDGSSDANQTKR
ncbi:uncharacterized protein STEHIDRAFT_124557 [Stereum hirsutum FP-91666 SS1]|uniref:uncharacterized protein n=1 Tax=Stereum hirsutum (strain FP-91666) TaxID=721885 RepID=UPI00044499F3|nr:uncharacterized protein STEHIDRAFT_124557 [Stereum hirsutum FP-91666 SS1]EIM82437.1 hypothetical protein STEHIDRAFT_124557 [Stereum hirsutum FP-91666 SS1]